MPMIFSSRSSPGGIFLCCVSLVAVTSLCILVSTPTTEGLLQEQYVGCFYDESPMSDVHVTGAISTDEALTIEKCIGKCLALNTTYAALQNRRVCHCRDEYGVQLGQPESTCNFDCSGNNSEICGGFIGQQIAYSLYTVCPIGSYGAECDKGCHCKHDIPCDRITGFCSDGCYGNWNGSACNITTASHQYIGCYKDAEDKALELWVNRAGNVYNTIQTCTVSCVERNYTYAGLQYYRHCLCGDSYDRYGTSTLCTTPCSGDSSTICGGPLANSVYSVCPVGNYGKSCTGRCHCDNGERCIYRNGSCVSSKCKEGWTGSSCNVRDCTKNNGDCYINETCSVINLKYSTVSLCGCSSGFQRTKMRDYCADTDECSLKVCDPDTTICTNTIGSYRCSCRSGFQTFNTTACIGAVHNAGAIVGSILVLVAVVAIALLLLFFYRRRDVLCKSYSSENISQPKVEFSTGHSSQENSIYNAEYQESFYANCSSVTVKDLPKVIQHKLSTQGVLDKEFKRVPMETKDPSTVGKNRDLKKKNRFQNIIPYNKNRVVLSEVDGVAFSDYINASVIKGYRDTDKLIATQGPLPGTINDFWRMVCEKDVNVIVMITDLIENNKNKCAKYWPDIGEPLTTIGITVRTTSEHMWNGYVSRHFQITQDSKSWKVTHWHFLSYPDHGVPESVAKFMTFLKKVRSSILPGKCTVVHCSAGAGRTGTFIAIDYLMQQGNAGGDVDILGCLQHLRNQRPQMIQNLAQYQFVHTALLFEYTVGDTTIPCNNFSAKFYELQKVDPNTGSNRLEAQLQNLEDRKDRKAKEGKRRVLSQSASKQKSTEAKVTFIQGWKQKDAYIAIAVPGSAALDDFYSLIKEFNCSVIVFLDGKSGTLESLFPTKEKPISLRSSTVQCDSSSNEAYGTCYKISELKASDETYANVSVYANSGEVSLKTQMMTVLHVTNLGNTEFIDCNVLSSTYNCIQQLNAARTQRPAVVMARTGDALCAFCLAALIALDMIRQDNEVDIFQIVQDIQKSKPQFTFSTSSYNELYSVVEKYVDSGLATESISEEHLYDVTK